MYLCILRHIHVIKYSEKYNLGVINKRDTNTYGVHKYKQQIDNISLKIMFLYS